MAVQKPAAAPKLIIMTRTVDRARYVHALKLLLEARVRAVSANGAQRAA